MTYPYEHRDLVARIECENSDRLRKMRKNPVLLKGKA